MSYLAAVGAALLLVVYLVGICRAMVWTADWVQRRRLAKRERIEAEIARLQGEMQQSLAELGTALGADAHEARLALIRESYRYRSADHAVPED